MHGIVVLDPYMSTVRHGEPPNNFLNRQVCLTLGLDSFVFASCLLREKKRKEN